MDDYLREGKEKSYQFSAGIGANIPQIKNAAN